MLQTDTPIEKIVHGSHKNLGFLLTRSASLWNEILSSELAKLGFKNNKPSHGSVLIPLFDFGEQSISRIVKFSKLKKQTMTTYIKELQSLGLIKQKPDPKDKRSKLVSLTKKGINLKNISQIAVANTNNRMKKLIDDDEFKILQMGLSKLLSLNV